MNKNKSDNNTEAIKIANALKPFVKNWFDEWGQSCVRSKKMTVTTAPNGSVIGVKDAFSDTEIFIKYMSSCSNAVVGDTVWVKWMYDNMQTLFADRIGNFDRDNYVPVSGGTFTGDVEFDGTVDIVNRRCYATLSSAGWHRVLSIRNASGYLAYGTFIRFNIIQYGDGGTASSNHEISLSIASSGAVFSNELSNGTSTNVTKIRATRATGYQYVDIYVDDSSAHSIDVYFQPYLYQPYQSRVTAETLQSVADEPSGETVMATHTFMSDGFVPNLPIGGVVDVVNRRCWADISTAGWYRIFDYEAATEARVTGDISFEIGITFLEWARQYHKITLFGILNALQFGDEHSLTSISFVDKIRYVKNGKHGYIDVHFTGSQKRTLTFYFDVKCNYVDNLYRFKSVTPYAVADAPSGETVLTTYSFEKETINTNHVALASLSSVGWYRVLEFTPTSSYSSYDLTGAIGALVKFRITRRYYWQGAENHEITLSFINSDIHFEDESSSSSVLGIDKIRYTTNSTTGFVDIHYICTQENQVGVDFDVYSPLEPNGARYNFVSKNLVSVSDAPSGETVRTTYTFNANGFVPNQSILNPYGDLANTGSTLSVAPSAVSVATSTWTTVAQLTLPAGRWVIFANARFNSNATGYRDLILSASADDGQQIAYIFHDTKNAVNGNHTYCSVSSYQNVTSETTRYLNVYQNSGSSLNVIGRMYAVRIS